MHVELDDAVRAAGVVLSSLDDAVETHAELVDRHLGSVLDLRDRFIAENSATWSGGAFVYVPAGVEVGLPLRLVVENPEAGARTLWRTLVVVEAGARLTLLEELAPGEPGYLNGALELVLGDGAQVDLVQTQELHHETYHFSAARAEIARDATLRWFSLGLGGKLGKARQESRLGGPGSTVRATGLYALGERQHLDLDTSQEHAAPNAVSDLAYKGALRDHARSVWRGIIKVDQGAQGTDAFQENRNLLLSGHAHADSIPGLQILANDVRCTHAATVSRVDSELLFFLMARGFARREAEQMLVTAFYADALARIENLAVRERFAAALALRIGLKQHATVRLRKLRRCGSSYSAARASSAGTSSRRRATAGHDVCGLQSRPDAAAVGRRRAPPGDRDTGDLESLREREWDACIDVSAYVPEHARAAAELLAGHVGHYVFISTASVYVVDPAGGMDETTPVLAAARRRDRRRRARALRRAQGRVRAGGRARVPRPHADHPPGHRGRAARPDEPLHLVGRAPRARRRGARARLARCARAARGRTRPGRLHRRADRAAGDGGLQRVRAAVVVRRADRRLPYRDGREPRRHLGRRAALARARRRAVRGDAALASRRAREPRVLLHVERARPRAGPRAAAPRRYGAGHLGLAARRARGRAPGADRRRVRGPWTCSASASWPCSLLIDSS